MKFDIVLRLMNTLARSINCGIFLALEYEKKIRQRDFFSKTLQCSMLIHSVLYGFDSSGELFGNVAICICCQKNSKGLADPQILYESFWIFSNHLPPFIDSFYLVTVDIFGLPTNLFL